ncbi:hypothetical protein ACP3VU_19455 [Vibrio sp. PNB23_22_6]
MKNNNYQTALTKCIEINEAFYKHDAEADTINLGNTDFPDILIPVSWGGAASPNAIEIAHKLMNAFTVEVDATGWFNLSEPDNAEVTVKASINLALLKDIHPALADKIKTISDEQRLSYEATSTIDFVTEEQFSLPPCICEVFQSLCDENILELADMELASLLSAGIASLSYSSEKKYGAGAPYADDLSRSRLYETVNDQSSDGTDEFLNEFVLVS